MGELGGGEGNPELGILIATVSYCTLPPITAKANNHNADIYPSLSLTLSGYYMPPPSLSDPWLTSRRFAVIIDAGSSGSRVQVYSWKDPEAVRLTATESTDLHILPTVEKGTKNDNLWQLKIEPGKRSVGYRPNANLQVEVWQVYPIFPAVPTPFPAI